MLSQVIQVFVFCLFLNFCYPNNKQNTNISKEPNLLELPTLSLSNLTDEVVRRNPDISAARLRVKSAFHTIAQAKSLDDPEFHFQNMRHYEESLNCQRMTTRTYAISQKIPFPSKLSTRGAIAQHIKEFVQSQEQVTIQDLLLQTKKFFFQLYLNYRALEINKENRAIVNRLIDGILAIYKTGRAKQSDAFKAQVELQFLDEQLLDLESEQKALKALLNALLNREASDFLGEPEKIFVREIKLNLERLERIAFDSRPEIHGLQAMVDEQKSRARLGRLNYLPDFDLGFSIIDNTGCTKKGWGVEVGINLPVWASQKQRNEVREAQAMADANANALQNLKASIKGRIKELASYIQAADEKIILYKTGLLKKSASALASDEAHYRVGKGDFLTVLDTRKKLQDLELDYESLLTEREILFANLERTVGQKIELFLAAQIEEKTND